MIGIETPSETTLLMLEMMAFCPSQGDRSLAYSQRVAFEPQRVLMADDSDRKRTDSFIRPAIKSSSPLTAEFFLYIFLILPLYIFFLPLPRVMGKICCSSHQRASLCASIYEASTDCVRIHAGWTRRHQRFNAEEKIPSCTHFFFSFFLRRLRVPRTFPG